MDTNLQGWSGNFVVSDHDHYGTLGVISSCDKNGDVIYIFFDTSIFYVSGHECDQLNLDEGALLHFDACYSDPGDILGYHCAYTADLVWIGKKPRFTDDSSSCYSSEAEEDYSDDESDFLNKDEFNSSDEEESSNGEDTTDYDESAGEYSEEDENAAVGFVGKVHCIVNSHTAVLKCQINGDSKWIALERCRLYVQGKLSNCLHPLDYYIHVGDIVNFDAAPVAKHEVFSFRVITAWVGKKPFGDQFVTPTSAPTHLLSSPWPTSFQDN